MRITFSAPYAFTATAHLCEAPQEDFFAICYLAASLCCQAMAAKYARIGDSTISADSTAHGSKSGDYSTRASEFMALYQGAMGIAETSVVKAGGAFFDWDVKPTAQDGRDYMFHGKGNR
jgi:hypothetical protein